MAMQEAGRDTDTFDFGSALENYLTPDFGEIEVGSIVKGEVVRLVTTMFWLMSASNPKDRYPQANSLTVQAM